MRLDMICVKPYHTIHYRSIHIREQQHDPATASPDQAADGFSARTGGANAVAPVGHIHVTGPATGAGWRRG